MPALESCATLGLGLWVGGLTLFLGVMVPVCFRKLGKEEAARALELLFPVVDRWAVVWGAVTCVSLFLIFMSRHFTLRSLVLEVPVGILFGLTLHSAWNLHPQIQDLRRRMAMPEFQGTAHLDKLRFSFNRLHRESVRMHGVLLFLGLLSLGLMPRFL